MNILSPYPTEPGTLWLKGNLHTHTTESDGDDDPQPTVDAYKELGYDYLMISDHDQITDVRNLKDRGMVLLRGNEISAGGPHILHVGAGRQVTPHRDRQWVINEINADEGFAILNHPNWRFDHLPFKLLRTLKGYTGIEIFNYGVVDDSGPGLATDKWDFVLSAGIRVLGYANDDSHRQAYRGGGFNVVCVREKTVEEVLHALKTGAFYASSGPRITRVEIRETILHVASPDAQAMGVMGQDGLRLVYEKGCELRVELSKLKTPYVRVEVYGFADTMAWTQPIYLQ